MTVVPGSGIYPAGFDEYGQPHDYGSYGTAVVSDEHRTPMLLTAAHVTGSLSAAHALNHGEVLLLSGGAVGGSGDPRIGDVLRSHPAEPSDEVHLDAALVRLDDHVTLERVVREHATSGRARDLEGCEDFVTVYKRGCTSGLTRGTLDPTPESLKVTLPRASGPPIVRDYLRGWFVEGHDGPFARPGDSGAIVVDEDECVVAMVVALRTDPTRGPQAGDLTFVVPICDVLSGLEVQLAGPDRACTLV